MFDCHCWTPTCPRSRVWPPGHVAVWPVMAPLGTHPTLAAVDKPSMIWSFHWSPMVNLQFPPGTLLKLKFPLASHLVNKKSSPSGSPRLTQHWVQVRASRDSLG